jgi:hypothetical protein
MVPNEPAVFCESRTDTLGAGASARDEGRHLYQSYKPYYHRGL